MNRKLEGSLSFAGGFVDTATFIGVSGVFANHITGNFVLFAAKSVSGLEGNDYLKLMVFPVFLIAVAIATMLTKKGVSPTSLLRIVAILLGLLGLTSYWAFPADVVSYTNIHILIVMGVVFAMGFQNAYHALNKELGPMTTVMTGNTSTFVVELMHYLFNKSVPKDIHKVTNPLVVIFPFLFGCIGAALVIGHIGLVSLIIPAVIIFLGSLK
jgi:uncharacterized membrane protein YoaK (UPF0700 family)